MDFEQKAGARDLRCAGRSGQEPVSASGGVDAADSRDRERFPAGVAPGLKIFSFWTGLRFSPGYFPVRERKSRRARPAGGGTGPGDAPSVDVAKSGLEPLAFVAGAGDALEL